MSASPTLIMSTVLSVTLLHAVSRAEELTLTQIADAWNKTQAAVESGRISFKSSRWAAKGSLGSGEEGEEVVPVQDRTLESESKIVFKGSMLRCEVSGEEWDFRRGSFIKRRRIYTWDSEKATDFNGDSKFPDAFIFDVNRELAGHSLVALQHAFRMNDPDWYVFQPERWQLTSGESTYDGLRCRNIELTAEAMGRNPIKATYSVCPDRNFSIVNYEAVDQRDGKPTFKYSAQHQFDNELQLWIPHSWTTSLHGKSGVFDTVSSTIDRWELNVPVADSEFVIDLPVNTFVSDTRAIGTPEQDFVLRANEEQRFVTRDELVRGATRDEIIQTETGMAGLRTETSSSIWASPRTYLMGLGILALVVAGYVMIRKRRE